MQHMYQLFLGTFYSHSHSRKVLQVNQIQKLPSDSVSQTLQETGLHLCVLTNYLLFLAVLYRISSTSDVQTFIHCISSPSIFKIICQKVWPTRNGLGYWYVTSHCNLVGTGKFQNNFTEMILGSTSYIF